MYHLPTDVLRQIYMMDDTYHAQYSNAIKDIQHHDSVLCTLAKVYKHWFIETYGDVKQTYDDFGGYVHYKELIKTLEADEFDEHVVDFVGLEEVIYNRLCFFPAAFLSYWINHVPENVVAALGQLDKDYCNVVLRQLLDPDWDGFVKQVKRDWIGQGNIGFYKYDGVMYYIINHDDI